MKTVSIGVENLCVPCNSSCRYCLLSSKKASTGVDYRRGQEFAEKFNQWIRDNRKDLNFHFYIGYCMDLPHLAEYIEFSKSIGSASGEFLQFNGIKFRNENALAEMLKTVKSSGVKLIDLTFYGLKDYHDKFAARRGDFEYLLLTWRKAVEIGLGVEISVPVTKENIEDLSELLNVLKSLPSQGIRFFLPHSKGRGAALENSRITKADLAALPQSIKELFAKTEIKTEAEWIREGGFKQPENRTLVLSLTGENIERMENTPFDKIIEELESLDDDYYSKIPPIEQLARLVGDEKSEKLYRFRDLYLKWQKDYINKNSLKIYDMNDESHSFSVRS